LYDALRALDAQLKADGYGAVEHLERQARRALAAFRSKRRAEQAPRPRLAQTLRHDATIRSLAGAGVRGTQITQLVRK
jgi:hypothetical protein